MIADFRLMRKVKKTIVTVKDIPKLNYVIFDVDGEEITAKKGNRGHLVLNCPCNHCGTIGIARGILCRRKLAVYDYILKKCGRITHYDIVFDITVGMKWLFGG